MAARTSCLLYQTAMPASPACKCSAEQHRPDGKDVAAGTPTAALTQLRRDQFSFSGGDAGCILVTQDQDMETLVAAVIIAAERYRREA